MTPDTLPPLPHWHAFKRNSGTAYYTADQMLAFRAEGIAAALQVEREACAALCESFQDHAEEKRANARAKAAMSSGNTSEKLARLRHASDVSLYHAGIKKCAAAIRARKDTNA